MEGGNFYQIHIVRQIRRVEYKYPPKQCIFLKFILSNGNVIFQYPGDKKTILKASGWGGWGEKWAVCGNSHILRTATKNST